MVERRVENIAMGVEVWIRHAVHRPRREMHKLAPGQVSGPAVFLLAAFTDASRHLGFHIVHRAIDSIAEGVQNPLVGVFAYSSEMLLGTWKLKS